MRVIPVIDLMGGLVVRGISGRRKEYRPIRSQIVTDAAPAAVALAFVSQFGFDTVYVADLDAIIHTHSNIAAWRSIAAAGLRLWLDAGLRNLDSAQRTAQQLDNASIEARLVIGLESLESEEEFASLAKVLAPQSPIFSLDMQAGTPLLRNSAWRDWSPLRLVEIATSFGIQDIIVLDLADVGTGGGTRTLNLCCEIRRTAKVRNLIAGGGVRGCEDLRALAHAGCDAALVASALHDGRLTREDVLRANSLPQ